jgi:hypothetical protein
MYRQTLPKFHDRINIMGAIGSIIGFPLAIFFALTTFVRKSKPLHPKGQCFLAHVEPLAGQNFEDEKLAHVLAGPALIRLSNSIWKRSGRSYDMLGIALRFRWREGDSLAANAQTQDLLLATVQHVWSLLFAPITTRVRGFFCNMYYALTPFTVAGIGTVKFRLQPEDKDETVHGDRDIKLANRVALGKAKFVLEYSHDSFFKTWIPIARIHLTKPLSIDQSRLHFNPFNEGAAIKPSGFINGLRKPSYIAAQLMQAKRKNLLQKTKNFAHNLR